jgi:hypothetical protein
MKQTHLAHIVLATLFIAAPSLLIADESSIASEMNDFSLSTGSQIESGTSADDIDFLLAEASATTRTLPVGAEELIKLQDHEENKILEDIFLKLDQQKDLIVPVIDEDKPSFIEKIKNLFSKKKRKGPTQTILQGAKGLEGMLTDLVSEIPLIGGIIKKVGSIASALIKEARVTALHKLLHGVNDRDMREQIMREYDNYRLAEISISAVQAYRKYKKVLDKQAGKVSNPCFKTMFEFVRHYVKRHIEGQIRIMMADKADEESKLPSVMNAMYQDLSTKIIGLEQELALVRQRIKKLEETTGTDDDEDDHLVTHTITYRWIQV